MSLSMAPAVAAAAPDQEDELPQPEAEVVPQEVEAEAHREGSTKPPTPDHDTKEPSLDESTIVLPNRPLNTEPSLLYSPLPSHTSNTPTPNTTIPLITFDSPISTAPNTPSSFETPKSSFGLNANHKMLPPPETPISTLLVSIQRGFGLSPAPAFDPDQTFGGFVGLERCEPLFIGQRHR